MDEVLGKRRSGIVITLVQVVLVPWLRPTVFRVHREEKGNGLVGTCAREARDGRGKGLEIEIANRRHEHRECTRHVAMQAGAAFVYRPSDDALQVREREGFRNVSYLADALGFERGPAFLGEPWQFVESVLGLREVPGAILVVLARVGRKAVTARCNVRRGRMDEHFLHLLDLRADRFEECARFVKDRVQLEQRVEIEPHAVVDVLAIEGEHPGFVHVDPGAASPRA